MARPPQWRCGLRRGLALALTAALAAALATRSGRRGDGLLGPCALTPPPPSAALARAPSVACDRWTQRTSSVSVLPELVERPIERYLHKRDKFYDRIVPDWRLQYKTFEQSNLYGDRFAVYVRELTPEGVVVQDSHTGIAGFAPYRDIGLPRAELVPGTLLEGARCTRFEVSVINSLGSPVLRHQSGIVYEWDDERGEGYIIPEEGQDAYNMIRVLRRDVAWYGSYRLFVGQFVQFETAQPEEVPIPENDEPAAPFALRVRSPNVLFSLREAVPVSVAQIAAERSDPLAQRVDRSAARRYGPRGPPPAKKLRRRMEPLMKQAEELPDSKFHPALLRWMDADRSSATLAESPAWMWEEHLAYIGDEDDQIAEIVPLELEDRPMPAKRVVIPMHEYVRAVGDDWQEEAEYNMRQKIWATRPQGYKAGDAARVSEERGLARRADIMAQRREQRIAAAKIQWWKDKRARSKK